METQHDIVINNKRGVQYKFSVSRKFTIIRGDSATGKTTLFQMISDAESSHMMGINISCDVPVKPLHYADYVVQLKEQSGCIIMLDEDFEDILSGTFAKAAIASDNCFIIITRHAMPAIPYSYKEIYKIKASGKFHSLEPVYEEYDKFVNNNKVVTEDEDSGFEYFKHFFGDKVITSRGNSNLSKFIDDGTTLIGDGSAIGPYIQDLLLGRADLFLPESFEYMMLNLPMFDNKEVREILNAPEKYITTEYASWERYFTDLLIRITNNTPAQYTKSKLNECFYKQCCFKQTKCQFFTSDDKKFFD